MGTPVQPADLPALKSGLLAGVHGLSGCRIEHHAAEVVGELLTLEARFTFYDGVAARKEFIEQHALDQAFRHEGQIRPVPGRVEVTDVRTPADAVQGVQRQGADA